MALRNRQTFQDADAPVFHASFPPSAPTAHLHTSLGHRPRQPPTDAHISRRRPVWLEKGNRQNQPKPEHIQKIIAAYQHRTEEPRYSRRVEMDEIVKNDFNLNISRFTGDVAQ